MTPSPDQFRQFLERQPRLCAAGLADSDNPTLPDGVFRGERAALLAAYPAFSACCLWLLDCTPMSRVSCVAPNATTLRERIAKEAAMPIPLGAVIAAVLYLRLPWHRPEGSSDIRVGISVRSPALQGGGAVSA